MSTFTDAHPHHLTLTKNGVAAYTRGHLTGLFPTDAGAVKSLLANPWLDEHASNGDPLVFAFARKADLKKFRQSIGHLKAMGYQEAA